MDLVLHSDNKNVVYRLKYNNETNKDLKIQYVDEVERLELIDGEFTYEELPIPNDDILPSLFDRFKIKPYTFDFHRIWPRCNRKLVARNGIFEFTVIRQSSKDVKAEDLEYNVYFCLYCTKYKKAYMYEDVLIKDLEKESGVFGFTSFKESKCKTGLVKIVTSK